VLQVGATGIEEEEEEVEDFHMTFKSLDAQ
jgi:hypothetical protein